MRLRQLALVPSVGSLVQMCRSTELLTRQIQYSVSTKAMPVSHFFLELCSVETAYMPLVLMIIVRLCCVDDDFMRL